VMKEWRNECWRKRKKNPTPGFLILSTVDILSQIIFFAVGAVLSLVWCLGTPLTTTH
jgi:hypothetical protein